MILLPPIQVYEGDGRNPRWDGYLHGDDTSVNGSLGFGDGDKFGNGPGLTYDNDMLENIFGGGKGNGTLNRKGGDGGGLCNEEWVMLGSPGQQE